MQELQSSSPSRREQLADAAIEVLAREGARGLTHRAVDEAAKVPLGTTSNYFRTRDALLGGVADRVDARLRPSEGALAESAKARPSVARMVQLMRELVSRILASPTLYVALLELRMEASRRPSLREQLTRTLTLWLEADVEFQRRARLPGGRREIVLLQLAFDGLLLDRLTAPDARGIEDLDMVIEQLTRRLVAK